MNSLRKIINISDKLSLEKPKIAIGDKEYEVNDSMDTVLKFEELAIESTVQSMQTAITISLGEDAAKEIGIDKFSVANFRVITIAIMAAMQGIEYEDAEARFQQ